MKQLKKQLIFIILFSSAVAGLSAQQQIEVQSRLDFLFGAHVNSKLANREILAEINLLRVEISRKYSGFEEYYNTAKAFLLSGFILREIAEADASIEMLTISQQFADTALKLKNDADCWRIKAEAGSLIMLQLGIPYFIFNASTIQHYTDRAIEIDPSNVRANVINAAGLIEKPFFVGGDVDKGVRILESINSPLLSDADRYFTLFNIGRGYEKLGEIKKAEEACREALRLYPGSLPTKEMLMRIKNLKK